MKCPECSGTGRTIAAHVSYADGSSGYGVEFPCLRCGGKTEVPDQAAEWIKRGRVMRDRRVHGVPYRNLCDEAKRRCIDVVTLSRMERGAIEPVEEALATPDNGEA